MRTVMIATLALIGLAHAHEPLSKSACDAAQREAVAKGLLGGYVPQCLDDGSFTPMQCHGSTGECWCVDTLTGEQQDVALAECQTCAILRKEMLARNGNKAYLPQCTAAGTFAARQCRGDDCYCADPSTGELSADLTACPVEAEGSDQGSESSDRSSEGSDQGSDDNEEHEHHADGDNEVVDQGSDDTDEVTEGTEEAAVSACFEEHQDAVDAGLLGNFIPQCMEDGSYAPMQCHGSTGECWCVDTLTGDQEDVDLAECQVCTLMHKAMVAQEVDDDFLPDCNDDGTFASRQCFKGDCYCADALTGELSADLTACPLEEQAAEDNEEATETTDANVETTEDTEEATTAAEQKENAQDSDDSEQGSESAQAQEPMCSLMLKQMVAQEVDDDFLPDCNDDGTFASRQCFKGDCYCADALTGELSTDLTACPDVQATEGTGETTEDNEDNEDNEDATEANLTTEDNEKVAEAEVQVINDDIVTDSDEDEGESEGSFFMGPQGLIAILLGITMIAISGFVITKRRSQAPDASANNKSFIYDTSAFDDSQTAPLNREAQLEELTVAQ